MNYDNTNSGALFKNEKEGKESRPDYKGTLNVNGTDYWISSWIKSSKAGVKYMSLSVQPKEGRAATPERAESKPSITDDIPF
jgi:hypothetical protein